MGHRLPGTDLTEAVSMFGYYFSDYPAVVGVWRRDNDNMGVFYIYQNSGDTSTLRLVQKTKSSSSEKTFDYLYDTNVLDLTPPRCTHPLDSLFK
jgi:hypothetical protein